MNILSASALAMLATAVALGGCATTGESTASSASAATDESGAKTGHFDVFAKSSIEQVNIREHAPFGASEVSGGALFSGLLVGANNSYEEYPREDWDGAQKETERFRLWAHLQVFATCRDGVLEEPLVTAESAGGSEVGTLLYGTANLGVQNYVEGAGWGVRYVLSGSPAWQLEGSFQAVKARENTAIYQYATLHVTCDWNGDPQATFDTFEGPSFGGTSFPTHNSWLFRNDDHAAPELHRIGQAWSGDEDPDGPGMKNLWSLPAVPSP